LAWVEFIDENGGGAGVAPEEKPDSAKGTTQRTIDKVASGSYQGACVQSV